MWGHFVSKGDARVIEQIMGSYTYLPKQEKEVGRRIVIESVEPDLIIIRLLILNEGNESIAEFATPPPHYFITTQWTRELCLTMC